MLKIETSVSDYELVKEHLSHTLPSFRIEQRVMADMKHLLSGEGEIECYHDIATMRHIVIGKRDDEFPFQVWPQGE